MVRYIFCITIVLLLKVAGLAQSYGLVFNSHEVVLEKRTALDLTPDDSICLSKNFDLSFEFNFRPNHEIYFGYVFRLVSANQNIDLIYNQPTASFKIITAENFSGISFMIDSLKLYKDWSRFNLKFDLEKHTLQCTVNGKLIGSSPIPEFSNKCFKMLWGANDFQKFKTRDIPPMKIKDIKISENNELKYFWPLDEKSGDICYDKINHRSASVKNPVWAKPKYQNWDMVASFTTNGYAGVAYDAKRDRLYVNAADSLATYTLGSEQHLSWLPTKHQNLPLGHQAIYDTQNGQLLDTYIDLKKVGPFNVKSKEWEIDFPSGPVRTTEYWHFNKFLTTDENELYFIGGYGYLRYKNMVQRYQFATKKWDTLKPSGDFLAPKYLAALGADPRGKYAYILGGYGSQTGDQMLDPRYYYDLIRYNIQENSFKKIYSFKPISTASTFANSLVIDTAANAYYGLIFSNDSYNSSLQLIKGSLTDSSFHLLGSPIPYSFHDVQSFADLYYSPNSNQLIAVTMLYSRADAKELTDAKEKYSEVKIYTLNFPPEPLDSEVKPSGSAKNNPINWKIISLLALAVIGILFFVLRKIKGKPGSKDIVPAANELPGETYQHTVMNHQQSFAEKNYKSSIFLFGQFQVFDKDGNDLTRLFTPLLKELFLVIIIYTIRNGRGISSEGLNEILWHDKSDKDAGNNRSVNLAKLKIIMEKIGNCAINKDSGCWQFVSPDDEVKVDYKKYFSLLESSSNLNKEFVHSMAEIIKRGPFLSQTEYKWLDDVKSDVSNSVIDNCVDFIKTYDIAKDPEFIIEISNCIFYFDQLNEDALSYKCKSLILLKRHTLANNSYLKFTKDYKDIYGEDFGKSFHDIIT